MQYGDIQLASHLVDALTILVYAGSLWIAAHGIAALRAPGITKLTLRAMR